MSDLIRREDAFSKFEKACTCDSVDKNGMKRGEIKTALTWEGIRKILENIPSAEPERTAKVEEDEWTEHKMLSRDYGKIYYQHDCCCDLYESPYQFCPYCGKKMKRKKHE